MTVQVVPSNNKEKLMHPSQQQDKSNKSMHNSRQQDYFRRLDRVLAARYVQECMLRRNRRQPTPATNPDTPQVWQPRMLLCDDPSSTRICATLELPGIEKDDLVVERDGDRLIVSGERKSPIPPDCDPARYPIQEIKYGKYRRAIDLAPGTLASTLSFMLKDGMLVITWPRNAASQRARVASPPNQASTSAKGSKVSE
ncbi:hypothetical protein HWV62_11864 [Athelia sp. TMB]|nr:hypothetical protein HWV62_23819 [Athelia sp. TMB]KAF7974590.1 hypothetical protein HWV62_11864 [Athelia sp. TMB]